MHTTSLRILAALVAAVLSLGLLAACGDDDGGPLSTEEYADKFNPINDEFLALGQEVAATIETAKGQTDATLAGKFGDQAKSVGDLKERLDDLDPPEEYQSDHDKLSAAMGVVQADLQAVSNAARDHDAAGARSAVQKLVKDSAAVRTPRRALAAKTGGKTSE
jgi:hypothetical protein